MLKKPLCTPLVKKIDLHFPLGLEVTARNLKGVTIKDALDAIYKQFKKKVSQIPFQPCMDSTRLPVLYLSLNSFTALPHTPVTQLFLPNASGACAPEPS